MTIDRHLQFSVLSAPVASFDRRCLSQAWYSALYGDAKSNAPVSKRNACKSVRSARAAVLPERASPGTVRHVDPARTLSAQKKPPLRPVPPDRRAPVSALARRIERTLRLAPPRPAQASFSIEGNGGRVQLLFCMNGPRLKIIAICPPRSKAHVAEALAHARYALASRGIAVDVQRVSAC